MLVVSVRTTVVLGAVPFAPAVNYSVGDTPTTITAADLDGDGDLDLAVTNSSSDTVSVLRNNGDGTFGNRVDYTVSDGPSVVKAADLDGDGDLDLAVSNEAAGDDVSVLLNNGDGTFSTAVNYPVGGSAVSLIIGDLDGDGDLDLATANQAPCNCVSVLRNNGDGTFATAVNYAIGPSANTIVAGDLDGDGDLDLVVTIDQPGRVSVLRNNGNGTFAAPENYAVSGRPLGIVLADFDNDGDLDVATAIHESDIVSVLRNNGNGTFATPENYSAGDGPVDVTAADVDSDGDLDLVVTNQFSDNVSVLLNNGNGTFGGATNEAVGDSPYSIVAADLDNDGDLDLATANVLSDNISVLINTTPLPNQPPMIIDSISPTSGPVGSLVTISGESFGASQGSSTVQFGSTVAAVSAWSETAIRAFVPLLEPGSYPVTVTTEAGTSNAVDFLIISGGEPVPVVLVHGWCGFGSETFGHMKTLLEADLRVPVFYFNYNDYAVDNDVPDANDRRDLIRLAGRFGQFVKEKKGSSAQVDVVAHSMGGLIARAWMAGLPIEEYNNDIRRLVLTGTPNFGVSNKGVAGLPGSLCPLREKLEVAESQKKQMRYGSQFLKLLNESWAGKVGAGEIRPQDIMTIVGCSALPIPTGTCSTDEIVDAASASLPRRSPLDYVVTYVKRDHEGEGDIADITDESHETYQLVKAFLKGDTVDSPYKPTHLSGLFVTPLLGAQSRQPFTETGGVLFGEQFRAGRALRSCDDPEVRVPIVAEGPFDQDGRGGLDVTGWWTITPGRLIDAAAGEGCLVVKLDEEKGEFRSVNQLQMHIPAGRPTITAPLMVEPR